MLSLVAALTFYAVYAYVINGSVDVTSSAATGSSNEAVVPQSVNFHFTRQCNYKCGFCFHTAKTSHLLDIEEAKRGLKLLKDAGYISVFCLSASVYLKTRSTHVFLTKFCEKIRHIRTVCPYVSATR